MFFNVAILIIISFTIFVVVKTAWNRRKSRLMYEAVSKAILTDFISTNAAQIEIAINQYHAFENYENGYFSNFDFQKWRESVESLYNVISEKNLEGHLIDEGKIYLAQQLVEIYERGEVYREAYNQKFLQQELENYSDFFNNIEGRKLDIQQRKAVIANEDNNLVVAGAGSGKTTTIVGKVAYLIDRYKVPVDEILLISFTNASALSLAKRIGIAGVEAKTFHKFGIDVISTVEEIKPSIFDESQFKKVVIDIFSELSSNAEYLQLANNFITQYLKPFKSKEEFSSKGEYIQYLKDQEFSTYRLKTSTIQERTTYKREVVKSIEECLIANFLLFNGVEYEYEYPYPHDTASKEFRQYKPDFTINMKSSPVYLEHFALNKAGSVPAFFADKEKGETHEEATRKYTEGIEWKKSIHEKYETKLVETYSYEFIDDTLFSNLTTKLTAAGVILQPKSPEEVWKIISGVAKEEVDNFINLLINYITLMKSNNHLIEDMYERIGRVNHKYLERRHKLFLEIVKPVFEKYERILLERNEIDFSDMINKAQIYIRSGSYKKKISYIIVDEFQDVSIGRYKLLGSIKYANPGCKLFCVGDDWQSIYRFTGSDIGLFRNFENHFGVTFKSRIETTYRFSEPLISMSSNFILRNPKQISKKLRSFNEERATLFKIIPNAIESQGDTAALVSIFSQLSASEKIEGKSILILGRYGFDLKRINDADGLLFVDRKEQGVKYKYKNSEGQEKYLHAKFMTVHKSKGLESDIVILINCNSGVYGFPSGVTDDPELKLFLSYEEEMENAEERRLFYVALTRGREYVYMITDSLKKSKFIWEIEGGKMMSYEKLCPICNTSRLVKKTGVSNGRPWSFWACSNYLYGCTYKEWE